LASVIDKPSLVILPIAIHVPLFKYLIYRYLFFIESALHTVYRHKTTKYRGIG
jgi:hypothetical protein